MTQARHRFDRRPWANCLESFDHEPIRSWPLFKARRVLRTLLINDNSQPIS